MIFRKKGGLSHKLMPKQAKCWSFFFSFFRRFTMQNVGFFLAEGCFEIRAFLTGWLWPTLFLFSFSCRGIYFSESLHFFPTYFTTSLNFFPILCTQFHCSLPNFFPNSNFDLNYFPTQKAGNLQEYIPLFSCCKKAKKLTQ